MAAARLRLAAAIGLTGIIATMLVGCTSTESTTAITYSFVGSSVAPAYHTEYRIDVRDGRATIRVGSYGTVDETESPRATESKKISDKQWRSLIGGLDRLPSSADAKGCTGGSTFRVTAADEAKTLLDTTVYACGDANQAKADALADFIKPVSSMFDIEALRS
ncbi:hypothetical protein [Gordonia crocea]|uniref:Lipoprotein n=1 Tax=Gordonia crocea TaxID=589162 RepID=A0A7I9V0Y8_9ACTN|nr:hypothetical protein [Gordonia crocea]GED98832.1 hypothetical protein nbrc107697_28710 [Gordonia crocea]